MIQVASIALPSLILLTSVIEDLRTKKVRNAFIIGFILLAFMTGLGLDGLKTIPWGLLSFTTAMMFGLPLFVMGALGAGDVKVFMAFSILLSWEAVLFVGVASLFWGALLGLLRATLTGRFRQVLKNTWSILRYQIRPESENLNRVPYTVALLFGWLSYLAYTQPSFWGLL